MCIAIYKPAGTHIPKDHLKNSFDNNKDGAGFAYINTDHLGIRRIKIYKTMDFDKFYEKYERALRIAPDSPFLIHFRIATHGTVDTYNCHPFKINDEMVFMHNGIITKVKKDDRMSDTQVFNQDFLKLIHPDDLMCEGPIKDLIEHYIGASKLVIMDIDGNTSIYNETSGHWKEDVWYSNYSYQKRTVYTGAYSSGKYTGKSTGKGATVGTTRWPQQTQKTPTNKRLFTAWSQVPCDNCGTYHRINEMFLYYAEGEEIALCKTCDNSEDQRLLGLSAFDAIFPDHYVNLINTAELIAAN